jgi:glutamate-1-semialdehyde aminotransferase
MADQVPVVWDHAEDVWVYDVDGNKYLDFTSGVLVTSVILTLTMSKSSGNKPVG